MRPDYDYYLLHFNGTISEADFYRLVGRAYAYLDQVTFGRLSRAVPALYVNKVKDAVCALAEELQHQEQGELASASNDGYSETYVTSGKSPDRKLYDVATMYLGNTGLLSRSVSV